MPSAAAADDLPVLTALGLMSGTSMDGIDVAVLRTDGRRIEALGPARTYPYDDKFRSRLAVAVAAGEDRDGVGEALTRLHGDAVAAFLADTGVGAEEIDVIGFHGHTVAHDPSRRRTVQIGDGAFLAELTGIGVVDRFRNADVAAGGEGAPLAPLYHAALAADLEKPLAILNIGGVANVTWIGPDAEALVAFDTGPGNAPLDDWTRVAAGQPMDAGGALAAQGRVDETRLEAWLGNPYFQRPPPKSLDRGDFDLSALDPGDAASVDGAATLTAFIATAAARAAAHFPAPVRRWLVTGGGRHNRTLMAALQARVGLPVAAVEEVGWNGDALEAQAFAYLAVRALYGLPLTLPGTTGAPWPLPGGQINPAMNETVARA